MKLLSVLLFLGSVAGFSATYSCNNNDGYELVFKTSKQKNAYLHIYLSNSKLKLISNYFGKKIETSEHGTFYNTTFYKMYNLKNKKTMKLKLSKSTLGGSSCPGRTICSKLTDDLREKVSHINIELIDSNKSYLFSCETI